tara:strand:- start:4141 stop:4923 length:783 start_codon:yes stop_codon:yes gene_type:complete
MSARRVTTFLPCGYSSQVNWSPDNLDSSLLSLWYKADTISGSDGDAVDAWSDSSGSGNNLAQTAPQRQPTLQTEELNSLSVLRFDGANDLITDGDIDDLDVGTGDAWHAAVFKSTNTGALQDIYCAEATKFGVRVTAKGALVCAIGGGNMQQNSGNWTRTGFLVLVCRRNSAACIGTIDGTNMNTLGSNTVSLSMTEDWTVGARGLGAGLMNGDVAEVLAGAGSLDTATSQILEGYLAHKWGLDGNLPSDHPYKSEPPKA